MKRQHQEVKDFLADIDAVLTDNSIKRQAELRRFEDLCTHPNQYSNYKIGPHADPSHREEVLNYKLREMARHPQSPTEDADKHYADLFPEWDGNKNVVPHYDTDYGDTFQASTSLAVDGVLYTATWTEIRMAEMREIHQW